MKKNVSHSGRQENVTESAPQMQNDMERGSPKNDGQLLSDEQLNIRKWLKEVRFKKKLFGGVSEADVWKKIAELNEHYEAALTAERVRYNVLMKEHVETEAKRLAEQIYEKTMSGAGTETVDDETDG